MLLYFAPKNTMLFNTYYNIIILIKLIITIEGAMTYHILRIQNENKNYVMEVVLRIKRTFFFLAEKRIKRTTYNKLV